jgi:uncharacterized protein YdaU (DUF1376 family)
MSRINIWFPFYVGDYRAETQGLSHEERGLFVDLLCAYCHRQAPLPDDDKILSKLVGVSLPKWKKARTVIAPIFTISKGVWNLPRLDAQIARGLEIREKRRQAGHIGGKRSWEKRQANAQVNASANSPNESKQTLNQSQSQSQLQDSTQDIPPIIDGSGGSLTELAAKAGGDL